MLSEGSHKALFRLYSGDIKALLRLYQGAIKDVLRRYYGCIKALLRRYYTYMRTYIRVCACVCVYNEVADERHMKMSVACVSYTTLAAPLCLYMYTHTHTHTHTLVSVPLFVAPTAVVDRQPKPTYIE
jgi:hypothetical protein